MFNFRKVFLLGVVFAAAGQSVFAAASLPCPDATGGTGGEIPTPFELNRRVELADGEEYLLVGTVVFKTIMTPDGVRSRPYFEIDLAVHSWLASAKRRSQPYYPLAAPFNRWKPYEGRKVKMSSVARGRIDTESARGNLDYQIELNLNPRGTIEPYDDRNCPSRPSRPASPTGLPPITR